MGLIMRRWNIRDFISKTGLLNLANMSFAPEFMIEKLFNSLFFAYHPTKSLESKMREILENKSAEIKTGINLKNIRVSRITNLIKHGRILSYIPFVEKKGRL